jgi:hypothetical protein
LYEYNVLTPLIIRLNIATIINDKTLQQICSSLVISQITTANIIEVYEISKNMNLQDLQLRCEKMIMYERNNGTQIPVELQKNEELENYKYLIQYENFSWDTQYINHNVSINIVSNLVN